MSRHAPGHDTINCYMTRSVFFLCEFFQVEKWADLWHDCKMCTRWWFLEERTNKQTYAVVRGPGPALDRVVMLGECSPLRLPLPPWYSLWAHFVHFWAPSLWRNLEMKFTAGNWGSWRTLTWYVTSFCRDFPFLLRAQAVAKNLQSLVLAGLLGLLFSSLSSHLPQNFSQTFLKKIFSGCLLPQRVILLPIYRDVDAFNINFLNFFSCWWSLVLFTK